MAMSTKSNKIEDALLEKKILTSEQYEQAKALQQENGSTFEATLIELKMLSEEDLAALYRDVFQLRRLRLEDVEIDPHALKHVPSAVAWRYKLIPVRRSGNTLAVVMTDPFDNDAVQALKAVTDLEIISFVGDHDAVDHALYVHYGECPQIESDGAENGKATINPSLRLLIDDERFKYLGSGLQINRKQTFDTFVKDDANQFALSIASSIAEMRAESGYNPFHIWGACGCGKSHLLQAMVNHITAHSPMKKYILTTARAFVDDLYESVKRDRINLFRYFYQEQDFLLIEDCDVFLPRMWAQKELVETYQELAKKGKTLILTAKQNLAAHPKAVPEFRKILDKGVIAEINEYSLDAKIQILANEKGGVELPPSILPYMAKRCGDSVGALLDVLKQISMVAIQGERDLDEAAVDSILELYELDNALGKEDFAKALASSENTQRENSEESGENSDS